MDLGELAGMTPEIIQKVKALYLRHSSPQQWFFPSSPHENPTVTPFLFHSFKTKRRC